MTPLIVSHLKIDDWGGKKLIWLSWSICICIQFKQMGCEMVFISSFCGSCIDFYNDLYWMNKWGTSKATTRAYGSISSRLYMMWLPLTKSHTWAIVLISTRDYEWSKRVKLQGCQLGLSQYQEYLLKVPVLLYLGGYTCKSNDEK